MAVLQIHISQLGSELRRLPARDREAIQRAANRTLMVDADRWIQWSIRGGGRGGTPPPRPRAKRKPKVAAEPPPKRSAVRKLLEHLGTLLGRRKPVPAPVLPGPKAKRPRPPQKPKDPCAKREAPEYRVPIDTGDYARSWKHVETEFGGYLYSAATPAVKAGVIEEGRRAAPIPIRPLAEWVRRKFGCTDPKKAVGIAIAISKAAALTPRPGLKVLARAHPKIAEAFAKNVERELRASRPGT